MSVIDKNMYEKLKDWCDWAEGKRPKHQQIMYVNSHDRALTSATIRKLMFEMTKEDVHGELNIALYSAENFYRNMRDYYSHIADLYMNIPADDASLVDIINDYPPACGWLSLIIEDVEVLSEKPKEMQEMMETVFAFSSKHASIILVGKGDYKTVFSGCEYALTEMADGIAAKEEDYVVMVGCYDQETEPDRETVSYESTDRQRDELNFYWDTVYKQLKKRLFNYDDFKTLYRETLEFIIPRVKTEQVYRKDISLIENIGAMRKENNEQLDGSAPWEFDAAREFTNGLHMAIINLYGHHDTLSEEKVAIEVVIKKADEDCGAIHISGATYTSVKVNADTVSSKMDKLSDTIREGTYRGNESCIWKFLMDKNAEEKGLDIASGEIEEAGNKLGTLREDIKEAADRTVNREPGRKVRRYKGTTEENTLSGR